MGLNDSGEPSSSGNVDSRGKPRSKLWLISENLNILFENAFKIIESVFYCFLK